MKLNPDLSQKLYYDSGGKLISENDVRHALHSFLFDNIPTDIGTPERGLRESLPSSVMREFSLRIKKLFERTSDFKGLSVHEKNDEIVRVLSEVIADIRADIGTSVVSDDMCDVKRKMLGVLLGENDFERDNEK